MLLPRIREDRASEVRRVPSHSGQAWKVTARSTKRRTCGCIASGSLDEHRLLDPGDDALEGEVDALDLDLGRGREEHRVELLVGERRDGCVHRQAHALEQAAVPPVHRVARNGQGALAQRLGVVVERRAVDVADVAHALAARTHAAEVDGALDDGLLDPAALVGGHDPARLAGRDVERVGRRRADVGVAEPAEEDAEHGVGVGGGADGRARVGAHPLLVDDDRRRQPLEVVHVGPGEAGHEALHEGAVGLVDHPLRLGRDRREHQRALARPRHPGEHGQPALGQLDADVLEVVLARPLDADQVVAVGHRRCRRGRAVFAIVASPVSLRRAGCRARLHGTSRPLTGVRGAASAWRLGADEPAEGRAPGW